MNTKDKFTLMTTAPIPRLIGSLAIPTIISMLVTSFYVMADTYFVGKINTQSTAAVGISFSIMAIIQAFGFFFGHGSGNYISRKLGAQDYENAEKMASTGFFYAFMAGALIALFGHLFLTEICKEQMPEEGICSLRKSVSPWGLPPLSCPMRRNTWASFCWELRSWPPRSY